MISSMTAFASARGTFEGFSWSWDIRGVNSRGLDLRLRIPDWLEGLEPTLRGELSKALSRGNVGLVLRISQEESGGRMRLNNEALHNVLDAIARTESDAQARDLSLAPSSAAEILNLRGVLESDSDGVDTAPLVAALKADFRTLLDGFVEMRVSEGEALAEIVSRNLATILLLTEAAAEAAEARRPAMETALKNNLARVMEGAAGANPDRVAQELAMIAVKADVTEELDRLRAHVGAARALLEEGGPVGRKLDFLCQEFNRETNTLCSKAQSGALTSIGLDLKAAIDQMREQIQNIE